MKRTQRRSSDRKSASPRSRVAADNKANHAAGRAEDAEERKEQSPTAVAVEALQKGVRPGPPAREPEIPGEDATIRVGDPDDDSLRNEYSGEDTPGGSTPTPDQNDVDEIGRAYGLQEEDSGALQSAGDVLRRRDRRRTELRAPSKPRA
jgi:hypothetical protein